MEKVNKLKKILTILSPDGTEVDFQQFDKEVEMLKSGLKEKIQIKTLEDVNSQLERFQNKIDLTPLVNSVNSIEASTIAKIDEISALIEQKLTESNDISVQRDTNSQEKVKTLDFNIQSLRNELATLIQEQSNRIAPLKENITALQELWPTFTQSLSQLKDEFSKSQTKSDSEKALSETSIKSLNDLIEKTQIGLNERINNIPRGGGAMNRQMFIGGVDPLTRYTDMNLKAGSNVTISYANNDTTKKVDVTFASSGGGGGSVRSINSISISTAAGSTSGTDYVYLCTGTLTLTLPTAIGNSNLYTIKNVGSGTVTVATTSAQTIDGSTTIILPVQYTAVDLISDTANWNVT